MLKHHRTQPSRSFTVGLFVLLLLWQSLFLSAIAATIAQGQDSNEFTTGNLTGVVDNNGHGTTIFYDKDGRSGRKIGQNTTRTIIAPNGQAAGSETRISRTVLDNEGRAIQNILPDGATTTTHYNAIGKVDYTVDALRRVTTHKYNDLGQRYETIYPDGTKSLTFYDENGQVTRGKDRSGRGSKTLYDSLGRATANLSLGTSGQSFKHENGSVIQSLTEYDDAGQAVATQNELGHISRTKYNNAGEAYQSTIYDQNNAGDLVPLTSSSQHDKAGRTTRSTDALGRYSVPQYDDGGRVRFMRLYDAEDKLLSTSETHYDALGRVDYTIDASNHMKRMVYDNLSRLVAVIQATQGQPTADGSGPYDLVTSFGYDELGQKIWQADANKRVTRFGYDVRGRQVWRRLPMGEMETMDYNVGGQLTRSTDFRGYTTTYTYDERGRTKTKTPDQRLLSQGESPLAWDYPDENTRVAYRGSASVTQFYDVQRGWLDRVENKVNGVTSSVSYTYNAVGQKTATNTASGSTFYSYDVLGRLATVRDQTVDSTTNVPVDIARYDYDAVGNLTSLERGNGVDTRYTFDEQNRLDTLTNKRGTSVLSSFDYTVRGDGKRTGISEQIVNADDNRVSTRNIAFDYDNAGKLTFERGQNGLGAAYENTWSYDAVGNRTGTTAYRNDVAGATQSWAHETVVTSRFNENDQLTSQTSVVDQSSTLTQSYTYDKNGAQESVASKSGNAVTGSSVNAWDFEGKLRTTQAKDAEGDAAGGSSNVFDAQGDRLWHVANLGKPEQKTTSYVVDTTASFSEVVEEIGHDVKDSAGVARLQARYVWGQGLAPLAMWRRVGENFKLFYFVSDGQESVRQLADTTGAVTDSYFYDAWGNTLAGGSGNTVNPFRYTGQQLDSDGRYYLRARFYNPGNGRFLSHDPLMGSASDPVSMHRYLYASGDGVNFADPSGKWSLGETLVNMGVNQTLVSVGATSINIAGYLGTAVSAYNIYSDTEAGAQIDLWDAVDVAMASWPLIGKGFKLARQSRGGIALLNRFKSFFSAKKAVRSMSNAARIGGSEIYETIAHKVFDQDKLRDGLEDLLKDERIVGLYELLENQNIKDLADWQVRGPDDFLIRINNAAHTGIEVVGEAHHSVELDIMASKVEELLHIKQYLRMVDEIDIANGASMTPEMVLRMEEEVTDMLIDFGVEKTIRGVL